MLCNFILTYQVLVKTKNHVIKNMLLERFWISLNYFIHKENSAVSKIRSSTENLLSMMYESYILELFILVLRLYSHCGDKK